jgi:plastocyanin
VFVNADTGVEHNFSLTIDDTPMQSCTGPCELSQTFTAPEPNMHAYFCIIHPGMFGFLNVE